MRRGCASPPGAGGGLFPFAATVLILRYAILPKVGEHQAEIEAAAGRAVGLPVHHRPHRGGWDGLNPELTLSDVTIADRQGARLRSQQGGKRPLLAKPLASVADPKLLVVDRPILNIRRDAAGRSPLPGSMPKGKRSRRRRLVPRPAPYPHPQRHHRLGRYPCARRHRWFSKTCNSASTTAAAGTASGISAVPPANLAARLDIRGELRGSLGEALDQLAGKVFVELQYADLAGWRAWVDYPVHLPQGRGAARLGDWNGGQAR